LLCTYPGGENAGQPTGSGEGNLPIEKTVPGGTRRLTIMGAKTLS